MTTGAIDAERKATGRWIGRGMPRREDAALVRGAGCFVDDLRPEGCLYLDFLRSPVSRGRIVRLDVTNARTAAGVVAIFTGVEVGDLGQSGVNALLPDIKVPHSPLLAVSEVVAVGQPVVAIVAETLAQARDALPLIQLEIEPPGSGPGAPEPAMAHRWSSGDCAAAFAEAAHVIRLRVAHARVAPSTMEPRAALASWDTDRAALTAWLSTQTPHRARQDLAEVLGLPARSVRVVAPDVGGAFGGKASIYQEDLVVAFAARQVRGAVKWCATRSDDLLAATQGRGAVNEAALAVSAEGSLLGLEARLSYPLGHRLPYSAAAPGRNAGRILPGPYRVAATDTRLEAHLTNTAAMGIYRGAGRPEAAMLMERLMDGAARALGMDPVAFRRRNLIPADALPCRTPAGERLDSGDYPALLDAACAHADYDGLRRAQTERRAGGAIVGIGVALYVEPCGEGWESARIDLAPDGRIIASTGTSAQGQGRETAFAQIVAEVLGVSCADVVVVHGDTARAPAGIGALASRSTAIGGSAMMKAAEIFRVEASRAAAELLRCEPDEVSSGADGLRSATSGRHLTWRALAEATLAAGRPVSASHIFKSEGEAWSSGCCIAAVSIDPETGVPSIERLTWVDDAGIVVNPVLVRGQLLGGMAQGFGEAMMEEIVYDGDGQLLTGSLMDYALPRAGDVPEVDIHKLATPSRANPLGAKGVGEAGCIGIPAAIVNAVMDALAPYGVAALDMPLTAPKIWHALNKSRHGFSGGTPR